jgi:hypothetical protein
LSSLPDSIGNLINLQELDVQLDNWFWRCLFLSFIHFSSIGIDWVVYLIQLGISSIFKCYMCDSKIVSDSFPPFIHFEVEGNPLRLPFTDVKNIELHFRPHLMEKFGWCQLYHHLFSDHFHDMFILVVAISYERIHFQLTLL